MQVAEKVHAYTRGYGVDGVGSTRVKDIVDLALVASGAELDAGKVRRAMSETFERRSGRALPAALPRPPADWAVPFGRLAGEIHLAADLDGAHQLAARLLNPILSGNVRTGRWDPVGQAWLDDGPITSVEAKG